MAAIPEEEPPDEPETVTDNKDSVVSRQSQRVRFVPNRLNYSERGGSNLQQEKQLNKEEWQQLEMCHNLLTDQRDHDVNEYDTDLSMMIGIIMCAINAGASQREITAEVCFGQQHILHKGMRIFGKRGRFASLKELRQLND